LKTRGPLAERASQHHLQSSACPASSLDTGGTFIAAMDRLTGIARDLVENYVIENVLRPLQQTIAIK